MDTDRNLYPYFHADKHGNIIAQYADGNCITIVHADQRAYRDPDTNANPDDGAGTQSTADNGRGDSEL